MIERADLTHVLDFTRELWEALRGERIFITGGSGFVGSWLVASFARANRDLNLRARAVVLTRDPVATTARLTRLECADAVDVLAGDGTTFPLPRGRFAFVVHAATQRFFVPDPARPLGILDADARTTQRVLEFAHGAATARMLFTSSGAVYGRQPATLPAFPEDYGGAPATTDPQAVYAHSKRHSETLCALYARAGGISIAIARIFAAVGPLLPLDEGYAAGNFIADALAGRPIQIAGDGTPLRSYLYAADLAIWLWTILFTGRSGRAYNAGGAEPVSIAQLAQLAAAQVSPALPVAIAQAPAGGAPARYLPDVTRARTELGLGVRIPVDEALRRTFAWHRARAVRQPEVLTT